jgi:NADPH2:quinone reductase
MKAVVMTEPGPPEVLACRDVGDPAACGPGELRVRLKAAGVNPVDTKLRRRGTFYPDRMPAILGCDGAGVVEEVGSAVTRFRPGDAVYFYHGGVGAAPGNYAQYAVLDERFAARKPSRLSFVEAAGAPLVLITAWESLHDRAHIQAGEQVLVHGGAGGVGHVAIQLAKIAGARVCTTVSSQEKARFVTDLGAERPVLYREEDFVTAVNQWTDGRGVGMALDTVGPEVLMKTFGAVAFYGDVVTILELPREADWKEARLRNHRIGLELMLSPALYDLDAARVRQREILEHCAGLVNEGKLRIHVGATFPLEHAAEAHRRIEAGGVQGKLVLAIED